MAIVHLALYRQAASSVYRGQTKSPHPQLEDEGFICLVVPPPFVAMLAHATSRGSTTLFRGWLNRRALTDATRKRLHFAFARFAAWLRVVIRAFNGGARSVRAALCALIQLRGVPLVAFSFFLLKTITQLSGNCPQHFS